MTRTKSDPTICPHCGGPKKQQKSACMVCADDRALARPWEPAEVERLIQAAREMCDVFRVNVTWATDAERQRWVALIDALDRRAPGAVNGDEEEAA